MYIYSSGFNLFSTWSRPDQTEVPRFGSEGHTYVLFHTTLLHSAVHTEYSSLDQSWQHITVDRHFSGLLAEYWHSSNSITLSQSYRVGQFSSILLDSSWIRYVYHHPWESWLGIYRFSSQFYPEWSIIIRGPLLSNRRMFLLSFIVAERLFSREELTMGEHMFFAQ